MSRSRAGGQIDDEAGAGSAAAACRGALGVQFTLLMHHRPQHLLQDGRIVRQRVEVNLHDVIMNNAPASMPAFPAMRWRQFYPANSGPALELAGARHSQPSSNATSCAGDSEIRPVVVAVKASGIALVRASSSACKGQRRHARSI